MLDDAVQVWPSQQISPRPPQCWQRTLPMSHAASLTQRSPQQIWPISPQR